MLRIISIIWDIQETYSFFVTKEGHFIYACRMSVVMVLKQVNFLQNNFRTD
jgi:hypothetical protein